MVRGRTGQSRIAGRGNVLLALVLATAACAAGDAQLSKADLVARARGIQVVETESRRIGYHQRVAYQMDCLDGTVISKAQARVAGVSGTWNRTGDYRLEMTEDTKRNRVLAVVTHVGARHYDDAPWVTVSMAARCTGPVPR